MARYTVIIMAKRADHKRSTHIGPGGIKCPCCVTDKTIKVKRSERRRAKQAVKREINAARE